jgi:hypothetical protein
MGNTNKKSERKNENKQFSDCVPLPLTYSANERKKLEAIMLLGLRFDASPPLALFPFAFAFGFMDFIQDSLLPIPPTVHRLKCRERTLACLLFMNLFILILFSLAIFSHVLFPPSSCWGLLSLPQHSLLSSPAPSICLGSLLNKE